LNMQKRTNVGSLFLVKSLKKRKNWNQLLWVY